MKTFSQIEILESRIAPATIVNPFTVSYQDANGQTALVHISKPLFTSASAAAKILNFTDNGNNPVSESFTGNGVAENLGEINLIGVTAAQDMNIHVSVIPQAGQSNQVNVGSIQAGIFSNSQVSKNIDLGAITIQGNLGSIAVGDDNLSTPAISSLHLMSMTNGGMSTVLGSIRALDIQGNFSGNLDLIGYQFASIGRLKIGGSMMADSSGDNASGIIQFSGRIGSATIGAIAGSSGSNTGEIIGTTIGNIAPLIGSLHITGSITGGSGVDSGVVSVAGGIGALRLDKNLVGGSAGTAASGSTAATPGATGFISATTIGTLVIKGSIFGGTPNASSKNSSGIADQTADSSGVIEAHAIGNATIGGNITGGGGPNSGGLLNISRLHSLILDGNLVGGAGATSGVVDATTLVSANLIGSVTGGSGTKSGAILGSTLDLITVHGSLTGGSGMDSGVITTSSSGIGSLLISKFGAISIGANLTGGTGATSGAILSDGLLGGTIGNLHIGGSVNGGAGNDSGEILAKGLLYDAVIHGNLKGDTGIASTTAVVGSGYIHAGQIQGLAILGNITSGANSKGALADSAAIRSDSNIVSLKVGGSIAGTAADPVIISAATGPAKIKKTDIAIQNLLVGKASTHLDVLAGYSANLSTTNTSGVTNPTGAPLGTPTDGVAQIGTARFESSLSASNIVAGGKPDTKGQFGTTGNTSFGAAAAHSGLLSGIANIIVAGQATGNSKAGVSFGFEAEKLGRIMVNGKVLANPTTPDKPVPVNNSNLFLLKLAPPK